REIHLLDEVRAADEAVGGLAESLGEEGPGDERCEGEYRIRHAIGGDLGEPTEEDTEDDHGHKGLNDGPGSPEHGLLVPNLDVAPDEEVQQLPVGPQFTKPQGHPPTRRCNRDDWHVGVRCHSSPSAQDVAALVPPERSAYALRIASSRRPVKLPI